MLGNSESCEASTSMLSSLKMVLAATEHSEVWEVLFQLLVLLAAALVIGMIFERFRQSAIVGYLLAGMLLGPGVFNVISEDSGVPLIAELGVSLLLFAIGLEFSTRRLMKLGRVAGIGGMLQVSLTLGLAALVCLFTGLEIKSSLAVGATVALSSTACVLRLLNERAELDSVHGRTSLGILLLQDVAVVPLVLFVTMLAEDGGMAQVGIGLAKACGLILALVISFLILSRFVLPGMMRQMSLARDRELLVLLAIVLAIGSSVSAHALDLSPALGAFLAGMMLAESPFATQIRSDIGGLKIIFITLFFASVGMLGDPVWIAQNPLPVLATTLAILLGKCFIITLIALLFRLPLRHAFASGIVLAQVGEFGIVIGGIAYQGGLVSEEITQLIVSSTLLTLFATPMLVKLAVPLGHRIHRLTQPKTAADSPSNQTATASSEKRNLVIIVGFGPSGQKVAEEIQVHDNIDCLVIDIRANNVDLARSMGLKAALGDASNLDFLLHHGLSRARAIIITIPDHRTAIRIVESVRTLSDRTAIIVRARYHTFVDELARAGATITVDEEYYTGKKLREVTSEILTEKPDA
ncbi:MAG: sodium:proton exchanger [Verrucomicrobiales bacterium]|nr:sodium:proton exchanger [Verrucomicrobiales bacterium]